MNKFIIVLIFLGLSSSAFGEIPIPKSKPTQQQTQQLNDICKYVVVWPGGIISQEVKCNKPMKP